MRVVWISDTNYHKILRTLPLNFSKNFCSFEKLYQKRHAVFHEISRHRQVGRKTRCSRFFFLMIIPQTSKVGHRAANDILKFASLHRMLQVRRVGRHTTPIRPTWQEG